MNEDGQQERMTRIPRTETNASETEENVRIPCDRDSVAENEKRESEKEKEWRGRQVEKKSM